LDVIYTDSEGKDIGVLNAFTFDLAYGTEENTFELTLDAKINECTAGSYVYVDRTEYGGIVDSITVDSKKGEVIYSGRTWHGILNSKVVQPDSGQDYYIVSGEANAVIDSLITRLGLTSLFKASSAVSPVTINNYQFYRYCYAYDGLLAMLNDYDAKLLFSYDGDRVELSVVPAGDYTEFDYNTSEFEFTVEQYFKPINHLICLGQGELADRQVVHLYVDASGKISTTQTFFGTNEVVGVYDYGNAKDIEELTKEGIKKLKELNNCDTVDIDFNSNDEVYDIGDLVGATDDTTGISVVQKITKKIVTIDDRGAVIKCKIDSGKYSKASLESGKETISAKDIDDIKTLIGADDISKYGTDVKNAIVEIGSKADNIADDNDEYNPNHNYVVGEYCISPDDGTLQKCVVATSGGSWATVKDTCFTKDSLTNVVKTLNSKLSDLCVGVYVHKYFNSSKDFVYTGISYVAPDDGYYCLTFQAFFNQAKPDIVAVSRKESRYDEISSAVVGRNMATCPVIMHLYKGNSLFVWAKYSLAVENSIIIYGFYIKA